MMTAKMAGKKLPLAINFMYNIHITSICIFIYIYSILLNIKAIKEKIMKIYSKKY